MGIFSILLWREGHYVPSHSFWFCEMKFVVPNTHSSPWWAQFTLCFLLHTVSGFRFSHNFNKLTFYHVFLQFVEFFMLKIWFMEPCALAVFVPRHPVLLSAMHFFFTGGFVPLAQCLMSMYSFALAGPCFQTKTIFQTVNTPFRFFFFFNLKQEKQLVNIRMAKNMHKAYLIGCYMFPLALAVFIS